LPAEPGLRSAVLVELVQTDLEYRLKAGEPARVEEYLRHYSELAGDRGVVLGLLAAEYELRRRPEPGLGRGAGAARFPASAADWPAIGPAAPSRSTPVLLRLTCPQCRAVVSTADTPALERVTCSGCGAAFALDRTTPAEGPRRLGKYELLRAVGRGGF